MKIKYTEFDVGHSSTLYRQIPGKRQRQYWDLPTLSWNDSVWTVDDTHPFMPIAEVAAQFKYFIKPGLAKFDALPL